MQYEQTAISDRIWLPVIPRAKVWPCVQEYQIKIDLFVPVNSPPNRNNVFNLMDSFLEWQLSLVAGIYI